MNYKIPLLSIAVALSSAPGHTQNQKMLALGPLVHS